MLTLKVKPPILLKLLTETERKHSVLLFDLAADLDENKNIRFDLNIIFKRIPIRRNNFRVYQWYIGTTGAEIEVYMPTKKLDKFTIANDLIVNYTNSIVRQQNVDLKIAPEIETEQGPKKEKVKIGEISYSKGTVNTYTSNYTGNERQLVPIAEYDKLVWVYDLPRGAKIVRDFLIGNMYLYAIFQLNENDDKINGTISAKPNNIDFYDENFKAIGSIKTLIMRWILWRKKIKINNKNGIEISVENENGNGN